MSDKLVYIGDVAYWMTPDGHFTEAEMKDGMPVEHFVVSQKHNHGAKRA